MKTITLLFLFVWTSLTIHGQDITGQWNGILKFQGMQLRVVFHITKTDNGYNSTMDSPDQGANGIPVTTTSFADSVLKIEISNLKVEYKGKLNNTENIVGDFNQAGLSFPMNLSRKISEKEKMIRPQEPVKPYPYYSEDVSFENKKDKLVLAGTLTLPQKDGNFPAVVLITGSGPQNRDEELFGHKPFLVLADYLTRKGIAVLRFDDRGIAASKGDFKTATTADFAIDVESAINYLQSRKEINKKKIGLIGHSEGGVIAPMVAAKNKSVSFIVLLAGTGIPGEELLLLQQDLIGKASGMKDQDLQNIRKINKGAFEIVARSVNTETLKDDLRAYLKQALKSIPDSEKTAALSNNETIINAQIDQLTSPWLQYFLKYDPSTALEKVKCPVLAVNGEKDLQVPPKINLEAIKSALNKGGNQKVTLKEFPGLNHLFQECKTGLPAEYATIEQTFSPMALAEVTNWILKQAK
ncbi:MAG: alpha/beta hydrolase [Bacteroidota bacterium]|nr:alpha/beta hydrolase [Bacteroidota bacterium]